MGGDVRFGSGADIQRGTRDVRFMPNSRHETCGLRRPLIAISGLLRSQPTVREICARSLSSALASLRSAVSWPSLNNNATEPYAHWTGYRESQFWSHSHRMSQVRFGLAADPARHQKLCPHRTKLLKLNAALARGGRLFQAITLENARAFALDVVLCGSSSRQLVGLDLLDRRREGAERHGGRDQHGPKAQDDRQRGS